MAGARALWRATGMKTEDFQKPIVAIANSFTQFVPGHVHLQPIGQQVKQVIDQHGGYGVEFNTIAVDGRFSGGTSGLSIGHVSPEAAEGGALALVETGDRIRIDIPNRKIDVLIADAELSARRQKIDAYRPRNRQRHIPQSLQAYAALTTSAAHGAVRDVGQLQK